MLGNSAPLSAEARLGLRGADARAVASRFERPEPRALAHLNARGEDLLPGPPNSSPPSSFGPGGTHYVDMPEIRLRHVVSCSSQDSVRDWCGRGWKTEGNSATSGLHKNFWSVKRELLGNLRRVMGEFPGGSKGIQGKMRNRGLQGIYGSSGEKSRNRGACLESP